MTAVQTLLGTWTLLTQTLWHSGDGLLDWIGLCSVLRPRQHSRGHTGDGFLQVKRPNQQYQSTEGKSTKEKSENANNKIHICIHNNRQNRIQIYSTTSPLVYTMGWLGDGSHRGQVRQAWMAVGLPPRHPKDGLLDRAKIGTSNFCNISTYTAQQRTCNLCRQHMDRLSMV